MSSHVSLLLWIILLLSMMVAVTLPRQSSIRSFVGSIILRFIFLFGPEATLSLLGIVTVSESIIHLSKKVEIIIIICCRLL